MDGLSGSFFLSLLTSPLPPLRSPPRASLGNLCPSACSCLSPLRDAPDRVVPHPRPAFQSSAAWLQAAVGPFYSKVTSALWCCATPCPAGRRVSHLTRCDRPTGWCSRRDHVFPLLSAVRLIEQHIPLSAEHGRGLRSEGEGMGIAWTIGPSDTPIQS